MVNLTTQLKTYVHICTNLTFMLCKQCYNLLIAIALKNYGGGVRWEASKCTHKDRKDERLIFWVGTEFEQNLIKSRRYVFPFYN